MIQKNSNREHSKAYVYLMEQLNASDSPKCDGYYPKIMEEIYDWEREEVEEAIWEMFPKNRALAKFLPKLTKYDGVKALKEALAKCDIPSYDSVTIAHVLYVHTGENKYLDVIKRNGITVKFENEVVSMEQCDCDERIGIEINSFQLFEELKLFFEKQVEDEVFCDIPVKLPYFCGYHLKPEEVTDEYKWYADKWYKCKRCGTLWEFKYPDFPAKGFVRKFLDGKYRISE